MAEAKNRQRQIEQRERELQGKLQGQQRTVEQTTADTRQRVEGECTIALWSKILLNCQKFPHPGREIEWLVWGEAVCLYPSCLLAIVAVRPNGSELLMNEHSCMTKRNYVQSVSRRSGDML